MQNIYDARMIDARFLYFEDTLELLNPLYRSGNAASTLLDRQRLDGHVQFIMIGPVEHIIANGHGFSLYNYVTPRMKQQKRNIWEIGKQWRIPDDLRLVRDMRPEEEGHYMLAPCMTMPTLRYLGAFQSIFSTSTHCRKLTPEEIVLWTRLKV